MDNQELVVVENVEENNKEKSFASGMNFYKIFWVFVIAGVLGVIIEMIYCMFQYQRIESRTALVLSQFNPVYGFGAVLMTLAFYKFKHHKDYVIFIGCAIIGSAFEFLCSFFQEMAFGTVSWYYTPSNLGIGDRISILYTIFWGILGIIFIRKIYPFMSNSIEKIPNKVGIVLTIILSAYLIFDMGYSSMATYRLKERREGVKATSMWQQHFDKHYPDEVMKRIYPNMMVKDK